jgi:carbonic anhydrase
MVELNAVEQALKIASNSIVQDAWLENKGYPKIHAWVYDIGEGHIRELPLDIEGHLEHNNIFTFKREESAL